MNIKALYRYVFKLDICPIFGTVEPGTVVLQGFSPFCLVLTIVPHGARVPTGAYRGGKRGCSCPWA